jgi:hypothetical protein
MSVEDAPDEWDAASAEEILRQGQTLIAGQFEASSALDGKAVSVLQAALSLGGASIGAAALGLAPADGWLPLWATVGFAVMATCFMVAAYLSALALRTQQVAAMAIRPKTLTDANAHRLPPARLRLALAYELDLRIGSNEAVARRQAKRVDRAINVALAAPLTGTAASGLWAADDPGLFLACLATLAAGAALLSAGR